MRSEFAETWRRFEQRPRTQPSLAARSSELPIDSDYLVYLVALDRQPAVARAARRLQARIDFPFVKPALTDALHLTMQAVGYRENLTVEQQAALVERAAPVFASLDPFEVTIGGANSFDVAAFLEVHDDGVFRRARAKLRAALPWLAQEGRDPLVSDGRDIFLPHVSIAYYSAEADARCVVEALAPHRDVVVARMRDLGADARGCQAPAVANWRTIPHPGHLPVEATLIGFVRACATSATAGSRQGRRDPARWAY